MSSPFQQGFMGKNPFKTAKRMTDAVKAADTEFYKDIDPYEAEGNRMEAAEQSKPLAIDDKTSYEYDYDQNPETTAGLGKKKSPLNNSPLNGAYSSGADGGINTYRPSDRQAFDALQGKITSNMYKAMDGLSKNKEESYDASDVEDENNALQNIITKDGTEGFGDGNNGFDDLKVEDVEEVYDPEDFDPYNLMPGAENRELGESYSPPGLTNKKPLIKRLQEQLRQDGIGLF